MCSIISIVFHFLKTSDTIAPIRLAVSGDAGANSEKNLDVLWIPVHPVGRVGAGANQTHGAIEDIEELREFVDTGGAHELPDGSDARVILAVVGRAIGQPNVRGVYIHRPELEHLEQLAILSDAFGVVENRPAVSEIDDGRENQERQQEKWKADKPEKQIQKPFDKKLVHGRMILLPVR